jgi:hypothetical protein
MIILLAILGFLGAFAWCIWSDIKKDRKKLALAHIENSEWLEEQKSIPRVKVLVITKSGGRFETESFEPTSEVTWGWNGDRPSKQSSLLQARRLIESSIKAERFYYPIDERYIPLCEIESFQII